MTVGIRQGVEDGAVLGYPHQPIEGRQTQTWVRFAGGWRIVAAHVSEVALG